MPSDGHSPLCLLLLSPGALPEPALLVALAERRLRPAVRHDALAVMTELCLRHRIEMAGPGDGTSAPVALAVSRPDSIPFWPELHEAVRRYLPHVQMLVWSGETLSWEGHDSALREPDPEPRGRDAERISVSGEEMRMLLE
jgi:hypothetical protein